MQSSSAKVSLFLLLSVLFIMQPQALAGIENNDSKPAELVIYTYDSFMAKGGLGPEIFPLFEKKYGCKVRALPSGDGAQIVSRLQLDAERGKTLAQVVVGLDQNTYERARPWLDDGKGWRPEGMKKLVREVRSTKSESGFVPFDYGVFAFMADLEALKKQGLTAPKTLVDLLNPAWKRKVILEDPRTSTPGLAFLLFANQVGGPGFWAKFRTQWLTLAPGWDGAYGLFLKGEAPLVWSYTTSQAYHEEHGDKSGRYRALVFDEGQPVQVEGAAMVKGASNPKLARAFLEFLLSSEVQSKVPLKNWMYPVISGVDLPDSFKRLPKPTQGVSTPTDALGVSRALSDWERALR